MTANRRRFPSLVILLAAVWPAWVATAAPPPAGEPVFGRRENTGWFSLENIHGSLDFLERTEVDTSKPSNGPSSKTDENVFEESFTLAASGYVIHPNLVDLNLSGTFGLIEETMQNDQASGSSVGFLDQYDLSALILRHEVAPVTVYARRSEELVNRQFGSSFQTTTTSEGARMNVQSKLIPTRFNLYRSTQDQKALDGSEDFTLDQDVLEWNSQSAPTPNQKITWDYRYQAVDQSATIAGFGRTTPLRTSSQFTTQEAALAHSINFGRKQMDSVNSSFNLIQQQGDFALERWHWDELMKLQHTDTFETRYQYTLDHQSFLSSQQTMQRPEFGFMHRLFTLTTTGKLGLQELEQGQGAATQDVYGELNFDYHRHIPYGLLSANVGFGVDRQHSTQRTTATQVLNQAATFTDPLPVVIRDNNIIPASIVIHDAQRLVIFQPQLDYIVRAFPDRVEIDRVIGGAIADGTAVLIDFQTQPAPATDVDTNYVNFGARYDVEKGWFKGLGGYVRSAIQEQTIRSASPTGVQPNSFDDLTFGADYRVWELTFNAERQNHESVIQPYDATRLSGGWRHRFTADSSLGLQASYVMVNYTSPSLQTSFTTFSGEWQQRLNRNLDLSVSASWHDQNDQLRGGYQGLEEQAEVRWKYRQTTIFALIRNASLNTDSLDNTFFLFQVGLKREF